MARSQKEGTIFILDVSSDNEFYLRARACIERSIQRSIFTNPKDEVGLIVMGADTRNHLNDQFPDNYQNLLEAVDLTIPTWNHIRYLETQIEAGTNGDVDWLDSIILAIDYARNITQSRAFSTLQIVLLTPECGHVDGLDQLDQVIESMSELGIGLKVVVKDTKTILADFQRLVDGSSGKVESIETLEEDFCFFAPKYVKGTPWNQGLTIGGQLEIKCAAYVRITDPKMVPSFKIKSSTSTEAVTREKKYFKNFKEHELDIDNMMNGYMYGGSAIPNFNFLNINFAEGCSQFALLGCTNINRIHSEFLVGDGCHVVVPQTKYPSSVKKFNALVRALSAAGCVMIARKMYNKSSNPKFNVLIPDILEATSQPILTMIEILFKEDLIELRLPRLRQNAVSDEQITAMRNLIDEMELSDTLLEEFRYDPAPQHLMRNIAKRAMKSREPVTMVDDDIKKLLDIPAEILKNSAAQAVHEKFPLEVVRKQTKLEQIVSKLAVAGLTDNEDHTNEHEINNAEVIEVGTMNPAEDYDALIIRGESFKLASEQLEKVLNQLVFKSLKVNEKKVAIAMTMYREHSKILGSFRYNDWIVAFKDELMRNGYEDFFTNVVVQYELGLITEGESENSTRKVQEVVEFYTLSKPKEAEPPRADLDAENNGEKWHLLRTKNIKFSLADNFN